MREREGLGRKTPRRGQAELDELAEGVLTAGLAIGVLTAHVANSILLSAAAGF
jgi:hypothetical protein